jgi:hypothetical protein
MSRDILRDNNKVSTELQSELASYGIMREAAIKNAPGNSGSGPKYFGLYEGTDEYSMYFTSDLRRIDQQDEPMQLAIVAPDNETFDLLAPKDYSAGLSMKDSTSLRRYLSNLLDTL